MPNLLYNTFTILTYEVEVMNFMSCLQCENCKSGEAMYFCLEKNEIVVAEQEQKIVERVRGGWKKGDKEYEKHRRQNRKSEEVVG